MKKTILFVLAIAIASQGFAQKYTPKMEAAVMLAKTASRNLDVAPYYFENNYLPSRIKAIPKGGSFLFITDTHENRNAGNSLALPAYVKAHAKGVNTVVFGGDVIGWARNAEIAAEIVEMEFDYFNRTFPDGFVWVQGNHDCNSFASSPTVGIDPAVARVSDEVAYETTVKKLGSKIVQDRFAGQKVAELKLSPKDASAVSAWMKMHYYYDDPAAKVRIVVIETEDNGPACKFILKSRKTLFELQEDFLKDALQTTPKGYNVAVVGHMWGTSPLKNGVFPSEYAPMFRAIQEFRSKRNENVVVVSGHFHLDDAFSIKEEDGKLTFTELLPGSKVPAGETLLVWTSCDTNGSYAKYATKYGLNHCVANDKMPKGTTDEHCFDVVTFTKKKLVLTRFGVGSDREFAF